MTRSQLEAKRAHLMTQAEDMSRRELSPAEQGVLDGMLGQIRELDQRITALENEDGIEAEPPTEEIQRHYMPTPSTRKSNPDLLGAFLRRGTPVARPHDGALLSRAGVNGNILTARSGLTSDALKGSNVVGTKFYETVVEELVSACPLFSFCNVLTTTGGNPMQIPIDSDGLANEGHWLSQLAEDSLADPDINQITMGSFTATSKVILASYELLDDASIDITALFGKQLARRLATTCEKAFLTGDGVSAPTGILTGSGTATGIPVKTTAAAGAFALDDILGAIASIEPAYLSSDKVRVLLNPSLLYKLRGLKDSMGRFLIADPIDGFRPTILGIKTEVSSHVPDDQMVIGDFSQFWIRKAKELQLVNLQEKYALQRASGFFGFLRCDSRWVTRRSAVVLKAK
jgi:HK97 family phage major capsid protein